MTLREARCLFTRLLPRLIDKAYELGFEAALGEVTRDPRVAQLNAEAGKGISNSLHLVGLAADVNLYKAGSYITGVEGHADLGAFWKTLDERCRWGGDFSRPDPNHYSITWEGRA